MTAKRCFNTAEAMAYLGIKRRSFEQHILPHLNGKGIKIGTCVVYEGRDLDAAWESFKIAAGGERPEDDKGATSWDVPKQPGSRKRTTATTSIKSTSGNAFASAASQVLKMQRHG